MYIMGKAKIIVSISLAVLITALALGGCQTADKILTEKNNGDSINLKAGDTVVIRLESNPTTGYSWILDEKTDTSIVSAADSEYVQSVKDEELVGAGGHEIFTFKAASKGKTSIVLNYERPWEEDEEPLETFEINISVN
jgi:inhibitor of cysteine peptidase